MTKHKKKFSQGNSAWIVAAGLLGLGLLVTGLLKGNDVALLNPKGLIAGEQSKLIIVVLALMLEIAIPTLIAFYFIAWKYRETNKKASYEPDTRHSKSFVLAIWAIPSAMVLLLAFIMWPATHRLAPQKSIASDAKPLTVQVIAMRWKWVFIYPEQNIATVNYVQIPEDTPVRFELSADEAPMSSFWIPHLGGQLYAMTGHVNPLNLMADTPGDYPGSSAEINGAGFAGMKFITRVSSQADFDRWVQDVRQSTDVLDTAEYQKLLEPSQNNPSRFYSQANQELYATMLMKYTGSHEHPTEHE